MCQCSACDRWGLLCQCEICEDKNICNKQGWLCDEYFYSDEDEAVERRPDNGVARN